MLPRGADNAQRSGNRQLRAADRDDLDQLLDHRGGLSMQPLVAEPNDENSQRCERGIALEIALPLTWQSVIGRAVELDVQQQLLVKRSR